MPKPKSKTNDNTRLLIKAKPRGEELSGLAQVKLFIYQLRGTIITNQLRRRDLAEVYLSKANCTEG